MKLQSRKIGGLGPAIKIFAKVYLSISLVECYKLEQDRLTLADEEQLLQKEIDHH